MAGSERPAAAALVAACLLSAPSHAGGLPSWDEAKAEHRVVVVRAASATDPRLAEQRRLWSEQREALRLRDVLVWEWIGDSDVRRWPDGSRLGVRERLRVLDPRLEPADWRVVLIGRDGEAKAEWTGVVDPPAVFDLIDAMPMGRREKAAREAVDVRR